MILKAIISFVLIFIARLSQKDLSEWSGVSERTLNRICSGERKPNEKTLTKIVSGLRKHGYDVRMDDLMDDN
jgi:predicted transcriptional regulator